MADEPDRAEKELAEAKLSFGFVLDGIDLTDIDGGLDISSAAEHAILFVQTYIPKWIDAPNEITLKELRKALGLFITTTGMTVGDVMKLLPYDEERARRIAVTEITRAYASGAQLAGEELSREFPGVRIIKTWFTNNDGLVCDICRPLNGVSVKIIDNFRGGLGGEHLHPPGCKDCRCWMSSVRILPKAHYYRVPPTSERLTSVHRVNNSN